MRCSLLNSLLFFAFGLHAQDLATPVFEELAAKTDLNFQHFNGKTGELLLPEIMGSGVALFDFDNDGDLDVFLVQGAPFRAAAKPPLAAIPKDLGDRLFRNNLQETGHLSFTDVTQAAGIKESGFGMGAAVGDVNRDGLLDLFVTNLGGSQLWVNRGNGHFTDGTKAAGLITRDFATSATFVDLNRDGYLDLFVANYVIFDETKPPPCFAASSAPDYCGPSAFKAQPDRLYFNNGDGTFKEVSQLLGPIEPGAGLGVDLIDADGDGLLDVYVANDGDPNHLWRNKGGGQLEEIALLSGVALNGEGVPEAGMGVSVADADGDGDEDIFLTHLERETNTLYLNQGGFFDDRSNASGLGSVSLPNTGFGTHFFDLQNDGQLDLFVLNGAVRNMLDQLGSPDPLKQTNQLFLNSGHARFKNMTAQAGEAFGARAVWRGGAVGDLDNDGAADLVVTQNNGPVRLFHNLAAKGAHWLGATVIDKDGKSLALGAQLRLTLDSSSPVLVRRVNTSGSYLSASDGRVLFGLGTRHTYLKLTAIWPDGFSRTFEPGPVDTYLRLTRD